MDIQIYEIYDGKNFGNRIVYAVLILVLILSSCDGNPNEKSRAKNISENTLNIDVSIPFSSLNPHEIQYSGSSYVFPFLHGYLVFPDAEGKLQKDLADYWHYDSEKFIWRIGLRENARFHDGSQVTSRDVIFSLEALFKNQLKMLSEKIDCITSKSPKLIEIDLTTDDPSFMEKIWDAEILPSSENRKIDYYHHPIGAGAFRFSHREGDRLICLSVNKDYHGPIPTLSQICFHYEPDKEKTWGRLLSGDTDVAPDISPENIEIMKKYSGRFYFNQYTLNPYSLMLFNTNIDLFSDPKVRRAITHAINRNYIIDNILNGYGKIATGPLGITSPFYTPDSLPILEYDPKKALSLLIEAGWRLDERKWLASEKSGPFEFTLLLLLENTLDRNVAQYIQLTLNDIGIKVNLVSLPYQDLLKRYQQNSDFQAVLTEISGIHRRPERFKESWISVNGKCSGMGCFKNERVTHLLLRFLDEKNQDEKKRLGIEIQRTFQEIQPATFLFHKSALDVMSKRIRCAGPFSFNYQGSYALKYASVAKE